MCQYYFDGCEKSSQKVTHHSRDGKEVNEKAVSPLTSTERDHNTQSMLGDRPMSDIEAKLGERTSAGVLPSPDM